MKKSGRLFSNVLVLGIGSVISKITVFFMLPLYTACLSPAAFGTVDILTNTAVLLLPFVSLCAPEAVFRFLAGGKGEREVLAVGNKLLIRGMILLLFILPVLSLFDILRPYIFYLFCYVMASVIHSYLAHILRARGQYGLYSVQQLFCTGVTVALAFLFLPVLNLGVRGYLMAIFLADIVTALILSFYLRLDHEEKTSAEQDTKLFRSMLRYAIPLIPTATLWWALAVFDHYLLLAYHGESVTGLYAAAGKLPALLTFAASIFLEAWHFAVIHEKEEKRGELFGRIYSALLPVLILFVVTLIIGSRFLVERIFAADFGEAALYVPLLSVAALFSALSSFLGSVYVVKLRSGSSLITALVGAAVNMALDFWWIPSRGAVGAMAATLVSYVTIFIWRSVHCRRVMPFCQHAGKLTVSTLALLVSAVLTMMGHTLLSLAVAALALAPFWHEIIDSILILIVYGKKIFHISTKRENRS
ncbi:MAG: oligosaccharide flippase family protein [Clostridia bacterium]|nr:oligosaccharide flippase family protein [Clostridia bacterium]